MSKLPIDFNRLTRDWVGSEYKPYGLDPKEGCDCFSITIDFLKRYGIKLPNEYKGVTLEDYYKLWKDDESKAIKIMVDFFKDHTKTIDPRLRKAGDFLLVYNKKEKTKHIVIYGGNNKIIIVNNEVGVNVITLSGYEVLMAFRGYE